MRGANEDLANLLEEACRRVHLEFEHFKVLRTINEVQTGQPEGSPLERLVVAGRILGLKCKRVKCAPRDILAMTRTGMVVLCQSEKDGEIFGVGLRGSKRPSIFWSSDKTHDQGASESQLRQQLGTSGENAECVVVEQVQSYATLRSEEPLKPLQRMVRMLSLEMRDVWLIVVFGIVIGLLTMAVPLAIETLVNTVAFGQYRQPVIILALIVFVFLAFSASLRAMQTYIVEVIQRRLFVRVAADIGYRIPRVRVLAFEGESPRELVNRFFDVVTVQKVTAQLLLDGITLVMSTLIGMAVLAFYHPWLLGFDVVLLATIGITIFVLGRGAVASSIKESKTKYHMAAWLEDLAGCPTAFRYGGGPEYAVERTDRLTREYLKARQKHFRILMRQILFSLGMQAIASTALLGLGGWLVISGTLSLGQLVAAELIVTIIVGSFAKLGKHMESYYDLLAAVDKLGVLFDLPTESAAGQSHFPTAAEPEFVIAHVQIPRGNAPAMTFNFREKEHVLFPISENQRNSRLFDVLFRLRQDYSGYVTVNGVDIRELRPEVLRSKVALVREIEVFEGSIAENIHLERPSVTGDDVRTALAKVDLLDDVLELPNGVNTHITSLGAPLTPIQLRKLMLARAVAVDPILLMIDGLLDGVSDDDLGAIMNLLITPNSPWTIMLASGRQSIDQERFTHVIKDWNRASELPAESPSLTET